MNTYSLHKVTQTIQAQFIPADSSMQSLIAKEREELKKIFENSASKANEDVLTTVPANFVNASNSHKRTASNSVETPARGKVEILAMGTLAPNLENFFLQIRSQSTQKVKSGGLKMELTQDGIFARFAKPLGAGLLKSVVEEENVLTGEGVAKTKAKVQVRTTLKPYDLDSLEELISKYRPQNANERNSLRLLRRFVQEIDILTKLEEKRLKTKRDPWPFPKFYGFSIHTKPVNSQEMVITVQIRMEKFDGDLSTLDPRRFSDHDLIDAMDQLAKGVRIIQEGIDERLVQHCDLKAKNILFKREGNRYRYAITDFDCALGLDLILIQNAEFCGTLSFASPESLFSNHYGKRDCYALGAIFCNLLLGKDPTCATIMDALVKSVEKTNANWELAQLHQKYLQEKTEDKLAASLAQDFKIQPTDSKLVQHLKPILQEMFAIDPLERIEIKTLIESISDIRSKLALY